MAKPRWQLVKEAQQAAGHTGRAVDFVATTGAGARPSVGAALMNERAEEARKSAGQPIGGRIKNLMTEQGIGRRETMGDRLKNLLTENKVGVKQQPTIGEGISGLLAQQGIGRREEMPAEGPTPAQPGVPVSARGAAEPSLYAGYLPQFEQYSQPQATPSTGSEFTALEGPGMGAPVLPEAQAPRNLFDQMTPDLYNQLSPEQQAAYQQYAQNQEIQRQVGLTEAAYSPLEQRLGERESALQRQIDELDSGKLSGAQEDQLDAFQDDLEAEKAKAISRLESQAARRREQLNEAMSFAGFSRSSKRAELLDDIGEDLENSIADIERSSQRSLSDYKISLLAQNEAKVAKLQDRLYQTQSQTDNFALQKAIEYKNTIQTVLKQSPTSPQSIIAAADKLKESRITAEKEMRKEAQDNFRWMVENYGSGFVESMDDNQIKNYAANLGMPASVLKNIGPTLKEYDRAWEEAKYTADFQYKMYNDQANRDHSYMLRDIDFRNSLEKMGIEFEIDKQKMYFGEQIKNESAARKYRGLYQGAYEQRAEAANGNALFFPDGTTHSATGLKVTAMNPKLVNVYPNGTKKAPNTGPNGLGGQCAWEARKWTDLTPVGNKKEEKISHMKKWKKEGRAAFAGEFSLHDLEPGHTILTNRSQKWGHVAVINAITDDGKLVLSEFNANGNQTYTNTRTISWDDQGIIGIWKTKVKDDYKVAANSQELAKSQGPVAMYPEQQLVRQGSFDQAQLMDLMEAFKKEADEAAAVGAPAAADYQKRYQSLLEDISYSNQNAPQASFEDINKLRKEVLALPGAKDLQSLNTSFTNMNSVFQAYKSGQTSAAAADQALVVLFQKMLDPGSVVREGEFARTAAGQSIISRGEAYFTKLQEGGVGITDDMRQDMINIATQIQKGSIDAFKSQAQFYIQEANRYNIDPSRILGPIGTFEGVMDTPAAADTGGYFIPEDQNPGFSAQPGTLGAAQIDANLYF